MLLGSSALSEFHTSLSKVLTLWHCVKVKQHYLSLEEMANAVEDIFKMLILSFEVNQNRMEALLYFDIMPKC